MPHNGIVERRNDGTRPRRGSDGELERPFLAGFGDLLEAGDPALHLAHLLRLLLAGLGGRASSVLVVVGSLAHRVADTLTRPFPLSACARDEVGLLLGELVVLFAPVSATDLTLFQITLVSAAEDGGGVLGQIQFQDAGHGAGQELPVVAHQHHTTTKFADELLESREAVEVEIVGRLIEQDDVESRQHQCRQSHPRRLPTRQGGHQRRLRPHRIGVEPQVGQHGRQPLVEVRGAGSEPVIQRG